MTNTSPLSGPEAKPTSGAPAKQLVIFLHGYGADGNDLIGLSPMLARAFPDAHFASPHAPFPCELSPWGRQWFSLQTRDPATMLTGANTATPLLNGYIDSKLAELSLDANALALVGFSQGTMMALHASLRRANGVAGIVGFSGALVGDEAVTGQALKSKPPICLIHGDADDVVPYGALAQANDILSALGVPVETHTRPNLGHGIDPDGLEIAERFLSRVFI